MQRNKYCTFVKAADALLVRVAETFDFPPILESYFILIFLIKKLNFLGYRQNTHSQLL